MSVLACVRRSLSLRQMPRGLGQVLSGLLRVYDSEVERRGTTLQEDLPVRAATCQQRAFHSPDEVSVTNRWPVLLLV